MKFWKQFIVDISSIVVTVTAMWLACLAVIIGVVAEEWWISILANIFAWIMFYPVYLLVKETMTKWMTRDERNSTKS
jgi:hypothetical protein